MIQHIVLFHLKPEVDEERIEWMMRETRIRLLKIPEVLNLRCGKRVDVESTWPFFISIEVENMEKLSLYANDPRHLQYIEEVIKPHVSRKLALDYEMEPGRDVRYS